MEATHTQEYDDLPLKNRRILLANKLGNYTGRLFFAMGLSILAGVAVAADVNMILDEFSRFGKPAEKIEETSDIDKVISYIRPSRIGPSLSNVISGARAEGKFVSSRGEVVAGRTYKPIWVRVPGKGDFLVGMNPEDPREPMVGKLGSDVALCADGVPARLQLNLGSRDDGGLRADVGRMEIGQPPSPVCDEFSLDLFTKRQPAQKPAA